MEKSDRRSRVHLLLVKPRYRPKRSFGQGNIFTPVCHSFCSQGGGVSAPNFRGGLNLGGVSAPNFWGEGGCLLQIFFGGVSAPNFRGGGCLLQFFGGGSAPNFQGGWGARGSPIFGIRSTFGRYASYWNAFLFTRTINVTIFVPFENGFNSPMALFIPDVKKIKGAAHKNGDVDGTCKRVLHA